ncbi:MAG: N-acetylglucosamine-6-phosphate deacetylase [Actinomycetota bacterium]|nr:N-acetylglucosamine-6-phosphate deacetylase [Actinomycetota bacterium]
MSARLFRSARLFDGFRMYDDAYLVVDGGTVVAVGSGPAAPFDNVLDLGPVTVIPGLVDLQVNGGGGVMFNDSPVADGVAAMYAAHSRYGTTSLVPTFITGPEEDMLRAVHAAASAAAVLPPGAIPAVHLEGPYVAMSRLGIHDAHWVRPPGGAEPGLLEGLARVHPLIATVAPEVVGVELVGAWVEAGVQVWLGHSDCDAVTAAAAVRAGASSGTHLYNAMSGLTAREPGLVGAILGDDRVSAGLIMDGVHVDPINARAACVAMGERLFLVSDCLSAAAGGPSRFRFAGREIEVRDGACRAADGTLAGSALTLLECVAVAVRTEVMGFEDAVRAATVLPARVVGDDRIGRLGPGSAANFVAVDDQLGLIQSFVRGLLA